MPLYLTGYHSSRITKSSTSPAALRRTQSSPLTSVKGTNSLARASSFATAVNNETNEESDDEDEKWSLGIAPKRVVSSFNTASIKDVSSAVQHAVSSMFSRVPERAGMNSTRIAEVLNFHKNLPPIVSLSHVHAILSASSKTEREIQSLISLGKLRKLRVTGRGNDMAGLGEILVMSASYEELIRNSGLPSNIVSAFCEVLHANPRASSIPARDLPSSHSTVLASSGFLVSSSFSGSRNLSLSGSHLVAQPAISRAASGTFAAVGGGAAFEQLGGIGLAKRSRSAPDISLQTGELTLSVPNIGPYLKLLDAGRTHLIELLRRFQHKQAPLYLLRERWDGAIDSDNRISIAKRTRGEFSQILPAKTKKWKHLNGLNFDWALEECLGAGMIELFETHSVGLGVRALV